MYSHVLRMISGFCFKGYHGSMQKLSVTDLQEKAGELRIIILDALFAAGSGHPGSSFSSLDVLTVLFFGGFMRYNPLQPEWEDRDYFLLSNGHAVPGLYAVLSEAGYFSAEELNGLRKFKRGAQGHPHRGSLPGIEMSSGSLGQGLSVGIGLAYGAKTKKSSQRVFVMMSDGEQEEGSTWEAVMLAPKYKLDNLITIIDKNGMQIDGATKAIMSTLDPLAEKYRAFGWDVKEINGHDYSEINSALELSLRQKNRPLAIISNSVRGKGVSFMEGSEHWHAGKITEEQYEIAKKEINGNFEFKKN